MPLLCKIELSVVSRANHNGSIRAVLYDRIGTSSLEDDVNELSEEELKRAFSGSFFRGTEKEGLALSATVNLERSSVCSTVSVGST